MSSDLLSNTKAFPNYSPINQTEKQIQESSSNLNRHPQISQQNYDTPLLMKDVIFFWIPLVILSLAICIPLSFMNSREDMARNVKEYINPCNFTNILTTEMFHELRTKIAYNHKTMEAIKVVMELESLTEFKDNFTMELENMKNISKDLKEHLDYQKQHRFECYKTNLCQPYTYFTKVAFYIYVLSVIPSFMILFSYIIKTQCRVLTDQPRFIQNAYSLIIALMVISHAFFLVYFFKFDTPCEETMKYFDKTF